MEKCANAVHDNIFHPLLVGGRFACAGTFEARGISNIYGGQCTLGKPIARLFIIGSENPSMPNCNQIEWIWVPLAGIFVNEI